VRTISRRNERIVIIVQTLLPAELKMIELGGAAIKVISNAQRAEQTGQKEYCPDLISKGESGGSGVPAH
jgi:hypothetical protein